MKRIARKPRKLRLSLAAIREGWTPEQFHAYIGAECSTIALTWSRSGSLNEREKKFRGDARSAYEKLRDTDDTAESVRWEREYEWLKIQARQARALRSEFPAAQNHGAEQPRLLDLLEFVQWATARRGYSIVAARLNDAGLKTTPDALRKMRNRACG